MKLYSFEKLDVWQRSRVLVFMIYKLTKTYPKDERFGLVSQLRRASVSVSSNLAEGSGRASFKEQARFSEISFGSLIEVLNQLILSNDLEYLSEDELKEFRVIIEEIGNKINSLKQSQLSRYNK